MHRLLLVLLLGTLLPAAAAAQQPGIELLQLHAFDPGEGKQRPRQVFSWPEQRQVLAVLRFRTAGYEQRKTVEVYSSLQGRDGQTLAKWDRSQALHAGEHEVILPLRFDIAVFHASERLSLRAEIKLAGGERQSRNLELVVSGPPAPEVSFTALKLRDPESREVLTRVLPGQRFLLSGQVRVSKNETGYAPALHVFGLLSQDDIRLAWFERDPFSDVYHDSFDLEAHNGRWSFSIPGTMPSRFPNPPGSSQPFELHLAVSFSTELLLTDRLGGVVLAPRGEELLTSKRLDDRLLRLERNWHWRFERLRD